MAGENPDDPRTGKPDEFLSKTKWQRFQILIMGPVMNLILAVVVTAVVLMNGAEIAAFHSKPPVVGHVGPGSPAEKAGIRDGDRIISVAGHQVNTWEQYFIAIGTRARRETPIVFDRDGKQMSIVLTPTPQTNFEVGDIGVQPFSQPHVGSILAGSPAEKAGLKSGDTILKVDDTAISVPSQLIDIISKKANTPVALTIARNGAEQVVQITPELSGERGRIGINIVEDFEKIKLGPIDAVKMSVQRNYEQARLIIQTVGQLITRETSTRQLMGPLAIAQLSGESAQLGWLPLFGLMATISLNLGLLNLLPIPVLDGGHIFIMMLEGLARRDFSVKVKEKMFLAGFAVLLMLMVTVIYNDLTRIQMFQRFMPWR
jgi:regulator of sigma E protease